MVRVVIETDEKTKEKMQEMAYRNKTTMKLIFKEAIDLLAKKEGVK